MFVHWDASHPLITRLPAGGGNFRPRKPGFLINVGRKYRLEAVSSYAAFPQISLSLKQVNPVGSNTRGGTAPCTAATVIIDKY